MVQQFNLSHVRQLEIIVKNEVRDLESRMWLEFCSGYPNMDVAQACLENVSPSPWQTFTRIWSVVFIPRSDSWVTYVLMVAFNCSLKLRALSVLYAETQKRYITTSLSVHVPILGIIIILCSLT